LALLLPLLFRLELQHSQAECPALRYLLLLLLLLLLL
jgi:hypothetical protein